MLKKYFYLFFLLLLIPFLEVNASATKVYLEYPTDNSLLGDTMYVQGWMMSDDKNSYIEIFIDNQLVSTNILRYERDDVIKAITGYGGVLVNPSPGFKTSIDLSNYKDGEHSVAMVAYDGLGKVLTSSVKKFIIDNTAAKMYLDYPNANSIFGNELVIEGWLMSTSLNGNFHVYIDDKEFEFDITRRERPDVIKAITGYGDAKINKTPGFSMVVSINFIKNGVHELKVTYANRNNDILESESTNIYVDNNIAKMYLDYPTNEMIFSDKVFVNGWLMSPNSKGNLKLYIDDKESEFDITRRERPDVIKAITGYGDEKTNKTPGFSMTASLDDIMDGRHKVTVLYVDEDGVILESKSTDILVKKNVGRMYLDYPKTAEVIDKVEISGWIMTPYQDYQLLLYVDDDLVDTVFSRRSRIDVVNAITGNGDLHLNKEPGFSTTLDLSDYKDGEHCIKIVAMANDGTIITTVSKNVYLSKYSARTYLDRPASDYNLFGTNLLVRGWVLTDCPNCVIKLFFDDIFVKDIQNRTDRVDVLNAFGNLYGKLNQNAKPGYEDNVDVSNLLDGNHKVTVKVVNSKTDDILSLDESNIYLTKYDNDIAIDSLQNNMNINGVKVDVNGWYMTDAKNISLKFYVDDIMVNVDNLIREDRLDIVDKFSNKYAIINQNVKPGFKTEIDLTDYNDGYHVIRVDAINDDTGEVLISDSRQIKLNKYISDIYIDYPKLNVNGVSMDFSGWVLTTSPTSELKFYIDDKQIELSNFHRRTRVDVLEVYKDKYENGFPNETPGFGGVADLSNYKDGTHVATVNLVNMVTGETLITSSRAFNLKKYDGMISLEYPKKSNFSSDSQLYIQGWELSESANSVVKVYIDGTELMVNREERQDVLNTYPNSYGGHAVNSIPGFNVSYDLSKVSLGEHVITVELYSSYGDLISVSTKKIVVFDNFCFGIDVSSHQGTINWREVKKNGIDFAIIRLGYGDNFTSQDDKMFINNVNGCVENDIPYGVYLYSYALNKSGTNQLNVDSESIDSEVAHTLRILNNLSSSQKANLKLPVFIDMEDDSTIKVGKDKLTDMADYYCTNIQEVGYRCGVYANKSWLNNYLNSTYLGNKYDIWLAHYTNDYNDFSDYSGVYQIWQYTSNGNLTGIYSDGLDMNISFKKYW